MTISPLKDCRAKPDSDPRDVCPVCRAYLKLTGSGGEQACADPLCSAAHGYDDKPQRGSTIATCPKCGNNGAVGERYCDCPAAMALRARIDADPGVQHMRAVIDRYMAEQSAPALWVEAGNSAGNSPESPTADDDETS